LYVKSRNNSSANIVIADNKTKAMEWVEGVRRAVLQATGGEKPFAGIVQPNRKTEPHTSSSGTGFIVNDQRDVLTNFHVVEGCTNVQIVVNGKRKNLSLRGSDPRLDLAAFSQKNWKKGHATFRGRGGIRAGDNVVILGYPLRGLLASGLNLSTGTISALAGVRNESSQMQISAPIQPGNSGGPVIDSSGNIIGIVVSIIDAVKVASAIGDIPQNINFAIKATAARDFLDANDIDYSMSDSDGALSAAI
jgi:S1-C subfamily serine protease